MIRAIDTNVAVRLLTNDDAAQSQAAQRIAETEIAISATVLVETEWVLRSSYRWSRPMCVAGLRLLLALPNVVQLPKRAAWAIDRLEHGADFADMMHLATAEPADRFVTFDLRLARHAGPDSPVPVETLA